MEEKKHRLEALREEMLNLPMGELLAFRDEIGLKAFNKIRNCTVSPKSSRHIFKRANKDSPAEYSARYPVPRKIVYPKEKVRRDPRFDDLSGEFNEKIFKQNYGFLVDVRKREKVKLEKMIAKTKNKQKKSELKQLLNRMEQQDLAAKRREKQQELEKEWKKKEREQVLAGKKPFFLKKAQKRALLEAELQKELDESARMKNLARKNKKIAAREKKKQWSTKNLEQM